MDRITWFEKEYKLNPTSCSRMITSKLLPRHIIWNYLKENGQIFNLEWQTVKYNQLKNVLINFWNKKQLLNKKLTIKELCNLFLYQKMNFNEQELNYILKTIKGLAVNIVQNKHNLHEMLIYHVIDSISRIDTELMFNDIVKELKIEINTRLNSLLKRMVGNKAISKFQMKSYLSLKRIDFNEANVDDLFSEHFYADKSKYILKRLPGNLLKNYQFNI